MREVAAAAGVSVMTVSYVYSQPERVAPATAAKVRRTAQRLHYPGPHPGARALRRGRAGSLGVVLGERLPYAFDDPQASQFLAGVAEVCTAEGVGLTLVPISGADSDVERVNEAAVDGFVVWTTSEDDPVLDAVATRGLPAVVHAGPRRSGLTTVGIDDRAAAAAVGVLAFAGAVRPLILAFPINRRRERLILAGRPTRAVTYPVTKRRWEGFHDAWQHNGGRSRSLRVAVCPSNDPVAGQNFTRELLASDDPPDAIAAMSDQLALGALRAARAAKRAVPADVAITGWDDTDEAARVGLTTVHQSLREQGTYCAELALGRRRSGKRAARWKVVERTSTSKAT
jgi:DNA-binding LacI/PurR family transcriptional regulator